MRGEVSSDTNDKLINEFDLVNNQRREKVKATTLLSGLFWIQQPLKAIVSFLFMN